MKRPDRKNYPNGVFGDISYDDRLERYCSYLENQNKRLRTASVVGQSEQYYCDIHKEEMTLDTNVNEHFCWTCEYGKQ